MAGLGPGCSGRWKIGDAVMALLSGGGQAQFVTVPEGHLMPIPKDMTFIQAAAIPEAWLTAFQLLHFVGEEHLSHQNSSSSFLLQNPLLVASIGMLFAFKEPFLCHFALVGWNPVCQTQILES